MIGNDLKSSELITDVEDVRSLTILSLLATTTTVSPSTASTCIERSNVVVKSELTINSFILIVL